MRNFLIAITSWSILAIALQATPQKYATGVHSLDAFIKSDAESAGQIVVGLTGFYGQDQPQQWLILTRNKAAVSEMKEYVIAESLVKGARKVPNLPNQDLPEIPIPRERIKFDSDVAFDIAERLAHRAEIGYDSVHYQLRCREQNHEPVWMVNMLDPAGRSVGIHYISAESGKILRSVWHQINRRSMTSTTGSKSKPVSLLYGGNVREISFSGDAGRKKREVTRIIEPKSE